MRNVKRKSKEIPGSVKKALALATCLRLIVAMRNSVDPRIASVGLQAANAAAVFERVAGRKVFVGVVSDIDKVWKELDGEYETSLNDEAMLVFIEFMSMIISRKDFMDFFNINPFKAHMKNVPFAKVDEIARAVIAFDAKVNLLYSIEGTITHQELMRIYFSPRVETSRVKAKKERDKSKKNIAQPRKKTRGQRKYKAREQRRAEFFARVRKLAEEHRAPLSGKEKIEQDEEAVNEA